LTYRFRLSDLQSAPEMRATLPHLLLAEKLMITGDNGRTIWAVQSGQFDFLPLPENYQRVVVAMDQGLQAASLTHDPILLVSGARLHAANLAAFASRATESPFGGILLFNDTNVPPGVAEYRMSNPRKIVGAPPIAIAYIHEDWIIKDIENQDPLVELTWHYRFLNVGQPDLITIDDYRNANMVVFAPRIRPNLDHGGNGMAFGRPFGSIVRVEVSAGGVRFGWRNGGPHIVPPAASGGGELPSAIVGLLSPERTDAQ
jgi:hypothetical protein